ncbi:sensor histidine kinase [Magnetospirillum sulfuroxidans]|uniref:histidine kinase n=1 Tax=Magnetospirillum sulfuroxidans TaxID=611300 RepID=A0ABS5I8F5_9PROT|nr:ATP-binding protein [Magnetospirillum sulfuroxidans]MBR9970723.1 PAS domain-containing protein [Magnetospirillum sulfuroxidans]
MASDASRLLRRPLGAVVRLYSNRLIILVAVLGVAAIAGLSAVVFGSLRHSRLLALDAAEQSSRNLAVAVTGSVARTVQSVDVLLMATAAQWEDGDELPQAKDADEQLRRLLTFTPHIRQLAVIADNGEVLGDSGNRELTVRWDTSALFAEAQATQRPMLIGSRQQGRFLGPANPDSLHSFIPFFRRIKIAGGARSALLVAAVNPLYFKDIFSGLELQGSSRLRLWRYDGTLLVGDDGDAGYGGRDHADDVLFTDRLKHAEFGTFRQTEDDGVERITSYRATLNWPLVISVGLSQDDVLARWNQSSFPLLWPVGGLALGLLVLTVVLTRALIAHARAQAMLTLSERVLETVSNGVAISDATRPDFPLVYVNPAFESMTGYSAAEVLGRNPRFLHGDDREQIGLVEVRKALKAGHSVDAVLKNYRADGTPYWNDMTISAVHAVSGHLTHFVAIQRDITEQERNRVSLREAYARIERYSAELERFSFILAHHLQEPARHIALYAQIIGRSLEGHEDTELRTNLGYLTKAGGRLKELLRDVQLYLAMDRLAMAGGWAETEAVLDKEWVARSQAITDADLMSGALPRVQVPPRRLADLFAILIDNAILFRHPGRPLRVSITAEPPHNGFYRFRFADNGMGIPPEFLDKVFGVFERLNGREQYPGNGVGLAIARKLVETLGGSIQAQSDGNSGTTILFTLPEATE